MINSTFFIRAHFKGLETGLDIVRVYSGIIHDNTMYVVLFVCNVSLMLCRMYSTPVPDLSIGSTG